MKQKNFHKKIKNNNNSHLNSLITESRNPATTYIQALSTTEILKLMNTEDKSVPLAVQNVIPAIKDAVDIVVKRFKQGGRLFYVGAGTSGRLGILDASEAPPTFGVTSTMIQGIIAGGRRAVFKSIEGAEDLENEGANALQKIKISSHDTVIGISASGRTPFVIGALKFAKTVGAARIGISCNPNAILCQYVDVPILPIVGPEVLTGSTRLKSGTAQKLVLNMISTTAMIKLGKVHSNLMIDLLPKCEKLSVRAKRIITQITGCSKLTANKLLKSSNGDIRKAILLFEENTCKNKTQKTK